LHFYLCPSPLCLYIVLLSLGKGVDYLLPTFGFDVGNPRRAYFGFAE